MFVKVTVALQKYFLDGGLEDNEQFLHLEICLNAQSIHMFLHINRQYNTIQCPSVFQSSQIVAVVLITKGTEDKLLKGCILTRGA